MNPRQVLSSRRGTSTQIILLLPRTLMLIGQVWPQEGQVEMPSVAESRVVSVVVFMEVSAW